jgi:hypothetical protein
VLCTQFCGKSKFGALQQHFTLVIVLTKHHQQEMYYTTIRKGVKVYLLDRYQT